MSRRSASLLALALLAACSSATGAGGAPVGASVGAAPTEMCPTGVAATPMPTPTSPPMAPKPTFPVRADPTGRRLVDADGRPFLLVGDAAWSLIAQLPLDDVDFYLLARQTAGYNALLVNLLEHKFSSKAPANIAGDAPFTTPGDFSTPNEAYFAHAESVLRKAEEQGFVVLLTPAYLGYKGSDQGWSKEMRANGAGTLRAYGRYVAQRFSSLRNIVWVQGGDADAPQPELVEAIAAGIAEVQPDALQMVHTAPESIPLARWPASAWLRLNAVYTYVDVQASSLAEHRRSTMPFILVESFYENEHGLTDRLFRTQAYQALLSGATGQISGNNPVWHFGSGGIFETKQTWQLSLVSKGAASMSTLSTLFAAWPWWELSPERGAEFVTAGATKRNERPVPAVTCDGRLAVVYVPTTKTITLDLAKMRGTTVALHWVDATNGDPATVAEAPSPVPPAGSLTVVPPPTNADGATDWLLVAEAS